MTGTPRNLSFVVRLKDYQWHRFTESVYLEHLVMSRSNILFDKRRPFVTGVCKSDDFSGYRM